MLPVDICSDEINSHCYLSDTDVAKVGSSSTHQVCIRYKNSSFWYIKLDFSNSFSVMQSLNTWIILNYCYILQVF